MAPRTVPPGGLPTWPAPDPGQAQGPGLPGGLEVDVLAEQADGWSHVRCSNGWEAWVDGRRLTDPAPPVPAPPPAKAAGAPSQRTMVGVAAVALVVLVAFLLSRDDGTTSVASGRRDPVVSGGVTDGPAPVPDGFFDEAALERAAAEVNATPVDHLRTEPSDDVAARAVRDAMRAAGFDLGPNLFVMPLAGGGNLLYVVMDESSPLFNLPDDRAEGLLGALAAAPTMAEHRITRLAVDVDTADEQGPMTLSFTARLDDLRQAQGGRADVSDRVAVQLVRR